MKETSLGEGAFDGFRGVFRAFSKGGRGGKNLGPKGDGEKGRCPLLLGRKIFDF